MKKIGMISNENLIVEMTQSEYESLCMFLDIAKDSTPNVITNYPQPVGPVDDEKNLVKNMSIGELVEYVLPRLKKLYKKNEKGVVKCSSFNNAIKSMFNYKGGIDDKRVTSILQRLQKRKLIRIEDDTIVFLWKNE